MGITAATGFFDGVHLGHRAVLERLVSLAKERGTSSLVLSFWPHPRTVLQKDAAAFRLLSSLSEKRERILSLGVDRFCTLPFTKAFALTSARDFFKDFLCGTYGVDTLLVGYDHRLGHDGRHSFDYLSEQARGLPLSLVRVPAFTLHGEHLSSTRIRQELSTGRVEKANTFLGYDYRLSGVVVQGCRNGRKMGFPTANMKLYEPLKQWPADGVYAVRVRILDRDYYGMTNIGWRPTIVRSVGRTIETHILDFDEDVYGLSIQIAFVKRLRNEKAFPSLRELIDQLHRDEVSVRNFFNGSE